METSLELEAARAALGEMTQRAREANGVAAELRRALRLVAALLDAEDTPSPLVQRAARCAQHVPEEHDAGRAFLARLEQLERALGAAVDPESTRYPMGSDQPAQLDCRQAGCRWHQGGRCVNVSPALTLQQTGEFYCWSMESGER
jgi:hypothetical protein